MIELYLIISIVSGVPKIDTYQTAFDACSNFDPSTQHIYKQTIDRRDKVTIAEGSCQVIKQFR